MPYRTQPRTGLGRRQAVAALVTSLAGSPLHGTEESPVRLAISETLLTGVNVNDARAAMVVWVNRLGREFGMKVEFPAQIFLEKRELMDRVRRRQLDAVAINAIEYRELAVNLDETVIVGDAAGGYFEYVLLVRRGAGIRRLADLRGRSLMLADSPHTCLAPAWLATLAAAESSGAALDFFGPISRQMKPSQVILPVFFGQADACLTTRREFLVICELNPQVSQKLDVLAASPELVSTCYGFRRDYRGAYRKEMIAAITGLNTRPAGQQIRTLFQYSELVERDASCMARSVALLDSVDKLPLERRAAP